MYDARTGIALEPIQVFEEETLARGYETRAVHFKGCV